MVLQIHIPSNVEILSFASSGETPSELEESTDNSDVSSEERIVEAGVHVCNAGIFGLF